MTKLTVRRVGNSLGVILPQEVITQLRVGEGDTITLTQSPEGMRLTPYNPEFDRQMELAQKGNKEERRILIADANKIVSMAVLSCESVTQAEIEGFCAMRHLGTEIFQEIASTREWIKKPRIQLALVTNPAVPLSITLPLVKYLGLRDLRNIGRDRNLPEGVRLMAKNLLTEKRG